MESKFLPDSVAGALKSFSKRMLGLALMGVGVIAIFALIFHNPYLDGFATASTFGRQSVVGNFIGLCRYVMGFVPAMFLFLIFVRTGLSWAARWDEAGAGVYNFMRGFVAVCCGAAAFGLIAPASTYGGMMGAICAADVGTMLAGWGFILGFVFLGVFFYLAGSLLHIKWAYVRATLRHTWRVIRWLAGVFHLAGAVTPSAKDDENTEEAQEDDTDNEDEDASAQKKLRATSRRRRATTTAIAAPDVPQTRASDSVQYQLPDPRFLERSSFGKNVVTPELKRSAQALEISFADYHINGKVAGIQPGPIVTLYEFMPERGVKWANISSTVQDMTRAMAASTIRIAHIPNTQLIGVEMPNIKPATVRYRDLIENDLFVQSKYKIPLALGVNIGGNPMYYDLAKMPHLMIAGHTGSGKSVFVQSLITSIVYHFTPDKCKLMIIDPKGIDFGFWDDIPHLITPIVKQDATAAVNALKWAVVEMENRYKKMAEVNARDIFSYNEIMAKKRANGEVMTRQVAVGTDEETGELLFETQNVDMSNVPFMVVIIDEVADLMTVARKEVETCVLRIAQKARAAGIHLIMATQRPDATVITGTIKSNIPTRISFQARSAIDSVTCLGERGAEQLLKCGDMLFSESGAPAVRIHGAFISDEELTTIGDFLRNQGTPEYAEGVTDGDVSGGDVVPGATPTPSAKETKLAKDADLYTQAVEIVRRDKKPTISYLQRRLGIGYNKAATIIERMEEEGVVSAPDANNKRHIL